MNITKNFTLAELTHTTTGLLNIPNNVQIENLKELAINILQPLRDLYGSSIKINSAFRSKAVNTLIKGATTSQHLNGEAADLDSSDNAKLFRTIKDNLPFDQLIWESGDLQQPSWVHVSYKKSGNRRQILRMKNGKYTQFK